MYVYMYTYKSRKIRKKKMQIFFRFPPALVWLLRFECVSVVSISGSFEVNLVLYPDPMRRAYI